MKSLHAALFVLAITAAGCSSGDNSGTTDSAAVTSADVTPAGDVSPDAQVSGPIALSVADIEGFEKGIARETELVREARQRSSTATTPEARGEAMQATFETSTIPAAAPVTGLSPERYELVRGTISTIMTTLDFQGKIDGPQSVDTARASAATKARLASDPYASLDPAGAAALKARIDRIAPLWIEYIRLTAVGG